MERDASGRVWIAEGSNLSWFDGHNFHRAMPFEVPDSGMPIKPRSSAEVLKASAYPWGSIRDLEVIGDWMLIGHTKGAAALDLLNWRWHAITTEDALPAIHGVASHAGTVLLAGQESLFSLKLPDAATAPLRLSAQRLPGIWPAGLSGLHSLPSGLYGVSNTGFWRYNLAEQRADVLRFDMPALQDGEKYAWSIAEWPAGKLWLGFWNDGLVQLDLQTQSVRWFHPAYADTGALRSTSIYDLLALGNRLIVATNRGLVYFQNDCQCFRSLNLPRWDAVDASGVIIDEVVSAQQSDQHGFWATVLGEGLARFDYNDFYISNQVRVELDPDQAIKGLRNNTVRAITNSADGLYVGSYGGGVQIAERRPLGQIWNMPHLPYQADRIEGRYLWHVNAQLAQHLLLSTGDGTFFIPTSNRQVSSVAAPTARLIDPAVKSARCSAVLEQTVFVGTTQGVFQMPVAALQSVSGQTSLRRVAGADSAVYSCATVDNEAWFGTASGLLRLDKHAAALPALKLVSARGRAATEVPDEFRVLAQSHAGTQHWLASNLGLLRAERAPSDTWQLVLENADVSNAISVATDLADRVWAGTSKGLIRFDPKTGQQLLFDSADGLFGTELNIGAIAFDGSLLHVGGNGGLSSFDPETLRSRTASLSPRIERFKVGNGPWQRGQTLKLPARHEPIRINFASNDYPRPKLLRYALHWRTNDDPLPEWLELGLHADSVVERLTAGRHSLEVRVEALDVPGSATQKTLLEVTVDAMWFQRPLTWALGLIGLVGFGFGISNWRLRWLRKQSATLRKKVHEQTKNLEQVAAQLSERNAELERVAVTDPLTGLGNRRRLFDVLGQGLSDVAILAIDLDHFKRINDQYGHAVGDAVLVRFAQLLQSIEPKKLAARSGGEEFILVLHANAEATPVQMAERLLAQTRALRIVTPDTADLQLTISIGVLASATGLEPDECLRRADRALYQAKLLRNAFALAQP